MIIRSVLLICSIFLSQLIYSQDKSVIVRAYKVAFGIVPTATEVERLKKVKGLNINYFDETLQHLNTEIYKNRQHAQREIIKRAYFSVLKRTPTREEVESYFNATSKRSKNFTEMSGEIRSYFKSEIDYPE